MKLFSKIRTAKWNPFVESQLLSWGGNMTAIKDSSIHKEESGLEKDEFGTTLFIASRTGPQAKRSAYLHFSHVIWKKCREESVKYGRTFNCSG